MQEPHDPITSQRFPPHIWSQLQLNFNLSFGGDIQIIATGLEVLVVQKQEKCLSWPLLAFFLRIKNQSALNRQWLRNTDDSTLGLSENVIELAVAAALYPSTFFYVQIIALNGTALKMGLFRRQSNRASVYLRGRQGRGDHL